MYRYAGLIQRGGVDQVAHGFGLRQVDASVQEGAKCEFTRFGEARARVQSTLNRMPQNHGRTVAGNLDQVFRGIGFGAGEVGSDDLIDPMAIGVVELSEVRPPRLPIDVRKKCRGNFARPRAGEANDSKPSPSGRSRKRDDGIGKLQNLNHQPRMDTDSHG